MNRLALAAVGAAVPVMLSAGPAVAGGAGMGSIHATVHGSTVKVSTTACTKGGTASLLSRGQANFAQGRQARLMGAGKMKTATYHHVRPGTYRALVKCNDGRLLGPKTIMVHPRKGAKGGLGGSQDTNTGQLAAGAAALAVAAGGGLYLTRRRAGASA